MISRRGWRGRAIIATAGAAAMIGGAAALGVPLSGGNYFLSPSAFTGGGGTPTGSGYQLSGAIGQPITSSASGSGYTVGTGIFAVMEAGERTFRITAPGLAANP